MKGKYMGILYETVRAAQNNAAENEFSFNRSLETRERNDSDRRIVREVQEQKGQVSIEQVQEFQRPARDYASIGSDVKKALEKADQMDTEKEMPLVSTHVQPTLTDSNERAAQQLTVHRTEAYGYFDELGKKLGKIAKTTETREDDEYAKALRGKLGAELANVNSVTVNDVEKTFYELSV